MAVNTGQDPTGAEIDTDAFKLLYPVQFHQRYFEAGLRPDGRTLGRARAVTVGLGAISGAAGSCLVKLGATSVMATLRASVGECPEGAPKEGSLKHNVELMPFCVSDSRSAASQELAAKLTQRLQAVLATLALPKQLGISDSKAAYHLHLDVYILNVDGAVFDALLLAVIAALTDTQLPLISIDAEGKVKEVKQGSVEAQGLVGRRLRLPHTPVAVTCALAGAHTLVDPTREEEEVSDCQVCVVLDAQARLYGVYKSGGTQAATPMTLLRCIEAAKLRYKEVVGQLQLAVSDAEEARTSAMQE